MEGEQDPCHFAGAKSSERCTNRPRRSSRFLGVRARRHAAIFFLKPASAAIDCRRDPFDVRERRKATDVPPDARRVRDRIAFRRKTDDLESGLPRLNRWWDALCEQHGLEPGDERCNHFGSHVGELVRNGLEAGDRVLVGAAVTRRELAATIQDEGLGFAEALEERRRSLGRRLGLDGAIEFADEIKIESRGRLYWKTPVGMRAAEVELSHPGTRIFLRKSLGSSPRGH